MKSIFLFLIFIFTFIVVSCNSNESILDNTEPILKDSIAEVDPNAYDSLLAQELGADDYGMKMYVMAFLKEGPNRDLDSAAALQLQMDHMANIQRMADEGKLVLAGPFGGDSELRGIYVFNVSTIEEAEELTNSDPAIIAGSLVMDLELWYGSAALMQVNAIHEKVAKESW